MPFKFAEKKEEKLFSCLHEFKFNELLTIQLKHYGIFEPRVVFINVENNITLCNFQMQLVQHVKANLGLVNQAESLRGFHPHITIAYRDLKKTVFYKIWEEFKNKIFEKSFLCATICLLKEEENEWIVYKEFHFNSARPETI